MSPHRIAALVGLFALLPTAARAQPGHAIYPHTPNSDVVTLELEAGQVLEASTCDRYGARRNGDTVLVVIGPGGTTYRNDDACGSLASHIVVRVPEDGAGLYRVRAQCYSGSRCGGEVAVWTREARPGETFGDGTAVYRHEPWARFQGMADLLVGANRAGAGGLFEVRIDARPVMLLGLHLRMSPLGLAGGEVGGVFGTSVRGYVSIDMVELALGVGGGASTLNARIDDSPEQVEPVFGLMVRLGNLEYGYLEGQLLLGVGVFEPMGLDLDSRIPLGDLELLFRGRLGFDGALQAQAGVLFWLPQAARRELGVFVLAGAAGLFYQPVCRFGSACLDTLWYGGPTLGTGLEWRP